MIKYLIPLAMLCVSAFGQSVSLHNFNTNQFATNAHSLPLPTGQWLVNVNTNGVVTFGAINTNSINTNGYVLTVNTNVNSVVYNAITNLSGGGGGGGTSDLWTNDTVFGLKTTRPVNQSRSVSLVQVSTNYQGLFVEHNDTNTADIFTLGGYFLEVSTNAGVDAMDYLTGSFGSVGESAPGFDIGTGSFLSIPLLPIDSPGVFGVSDGLAGYQIGVGGLAFARLNGQTNVGASFRASSNGKTSTKNIALLLENSSTASQNTPIAHSAPIGSTLLHMDTRDSSDWFMRFSTNNGASGQLLGVNPTADLVIPQNDGIGKVLMDSDGAGTARWRALGYQTNAITTNTPAGMTNVVIAIAESITNGYTFVNGYQTNFATTNTSAGLTNAILSALTNNQGLFVANGRTNFFGMFSPNTNLLSWTNTLGSVAMFATNGTGIGIRNGDTPDGSSAVDFSLYGHYGSASTWDSLSMLWSVAFGDYEIMTKQASSGSARQLTFGVGGTRYWDISTAGHLLPITSGTTDIGAGSDGIRNLWVTGGRVLFDNTGVAGIGQIGYAGSPGSAINFQGQRIGFVDAFNAVDIARIETGSVTPPSKTIVDIGACIIGAGSATGSRNSWFGQDPFNTGNRWVFGTNNTTQAQPAANDIMGSAASGNHSWGGDLRHIGGLSTGSGTNGSLILSTAEGGSAITTPNTPKMRYYLPPEPITVTESAANLICTVSNITSGKHFSLKMICETSANDGTTFQQLYEEFMVSDSNPTGTIGAGTKSAPANTVMDGSGTLTTVYTLVAHSNGLDINVNPVSSLTQTSFKTRWRIESLDSDTIPHIYDAGGKHL